MIITSVIEVKTEGCMKKHKIVKKPKSEELPSPVENSEEAVEPHSHQTKSEAKTNKNKFFHSVQNENAGIKQEVNVTVNVHPEKDDNGVTGCFKSLFKCMK